MFLAVFVLWSWFTSNALWRVRSQGAHSAEGGKPMMLSHCCLVASTYLSSDLTIAVLEQQLILRHKKGTHMFFFACLLARESINKTTLQPNRNLRCLYQNSVLRSLPVF
ncbi:hypothetical protein OH492_18540 [Vibrio chagasii]|nr:hypothetical protein [Vibrio chagasii]